MKKKISILIVALLSTFVAIAGPGAIFNGEYIKFLKDKLKFKTGTSEISVSGADMTIDTGVATINGEMRVVSTSQSSVPCPSMTTSNRTGISSPTNGSCVYDTDLGHTYVYSTVSSSWKQSSHTPELDRFYFEDWEGNSSADVTTSGIIGVSDETTSPIAGYRTLVVSQQSGSSGATVTPATITLDENQKNSTIGYQFRYTYDGGSSDYDLVLQEIGAVTQEIGRISLPAASSPTTARLIANTTTQATALKAYFEVITENSGKLLKVDNIEAKTNPLPTVESVETGYYRIDQIGSALTDRSSEIEFNLGTATISDESNGFLTVSDDSGNTRTKFIVNKDCKMIISASAPLTTAGYAIGIAVNGVGIQEGSGVPAGSYKSQVSTELDLKAGDYVTIATMSSDLSFADSIHNGGNTVNVQISLKATSANVVFEGEDDNVEYFYVPYSTNFFDATTATDEWDHSLIKDKNGNSDPSASTSSLLTIADVSGQTRITAEKDIELKISSSAAADSGGAIQILNSSAEILAQDQISAATGFKGNVQITIKLFKDDYIYINNTDPFSDRAGSIGLLAETISEKIYSVPVANDRKASASGSSNGSTVITAATTNIDFTETLDTHSAFDGTTYTVQKAGSVLKISGHLYFTGSAQRVVQLYVNGADTRRISEIVTSDNHKFEYISSIGEFSKDDALTIRVAGTGGTLNTGSIYHYINITEEFPEKGYFLGNLSQPVATIKDVKATGTSGGSSSASWATRTLNTLNDPYGIVSSLSSNQFTLEAGTYEFDIVVPAYLANQSKAKLVSDPSGTPVTELVGTPEFDGNTAQSTNSIIKGIVTITSSTTFEVQHYTATATATFGYGRASGMSEVEVYTQVKIRKLR